MKSQRGASHTLRKPIKNRLTEAGVIALVSVGLYLILSLFTYNPNDPSWANTHAFESATNWGGGVGAWLAHTMYFLFGMPAIIFPFVCFFVARDMIRVKEAMHYGAQMAGFGLVLISTCGLARLHFTQGSLPATAGGVIGDYAAIGFLNVFGLIGATMLLLALFAVSLPLVTTCSWLRVIDMLGLFTLRLTEQLMKLPQRYDDWRAGQDAKIKRVADVKKHIVRSGSKKKIKLEPKITPLKESARVQKEKQIPLLGAADSFALPRLGLLDMPQKKTDQLNAAALQSLAELLQIKLADFGVDAQVVEVLPGPVITRMELSLGPGVKSSTVTNLENDLARALSKPSIRVQEVVPGKSVIGIELPNEVREIVSLKEILSSDAYEKATSPLTLALGKEVAGEPVLMDLAKMPHLLIAGTTGSGKSVLVHAVLMSMLFRSGPEDVRLVLVDPKMLELNVYNDIPHLLTPVITDVTQSRNALSWVVNEMERRYRLMSALNVRNISSYNRTVKKADDEGKPLKNPLTDSDSDSSESEKEETLKKMPYIVVVIDEFADMIMVIGKQVEQIIARLAQKARAAGIHLILATQRPSVDVITGLVKANIPARIALQVSSKTDSRTIIDRNGAEQLLGQGDMLYVDPATSVPVRVHGAFVSDEEVLAVTSSLKKNKPMDYIESIVQEQPDTLSNGGGGNDEQDPLYDEALAIIIESKRTSISYLQRRLRVGYNRAARLIEDMESAGAVSPPQPDGTRDIYATDHPKE